MADKNYNVPGTDDVVKEDKPCGNIYEIAKSVVGSKYINYGGSTKKGPEIKGGQNGAA